jgi:hypothetical protein
MSANVALPGPAPLVLTSRAIDAVIVRAWCLSPSLPRRVARDPLSVIAGGPARAGAPLVFQRTHVPYRAIRRERRMLRPLLLLR